VCEVMWVGAEPCKDRAHVAEAVRDSQRCQMKIRQPIPTGLVLFGLVSIVASAGFVRLGIWQMNRHREVKGQSAIQEARIAMDPVALELVLNQVNNIDSLLWRRVEIRGSWDADREVIVRSRARSGVPGIHVVTPLLLDGQVGDGGEGNLSVLVLRGWLPSPNVTTVSLGNAHPTTTVPSSVPQVALVRASRSGHGGPMVMLSAGETRIASYAAVDVELIAGETNGTLPFFLQLLPEEGGTPGGSGEPIPVPLPVPTNGPHLVYMIQWFSFALITIIGSVVFIRRGSRRRNRPVPLS